MKYLIGTGLSGLVGSRIVELLSSKYKFEDISLATGVDITDSKAVETQIQKSRAEWVLHLAAKTDVDACEKDKALGKSGGAWKINVEGTRNVVEAAKKYGKHTLLVSTDFVFDGVQEVYTETDIPRPVNWYAQTKYEAEKIILQDPKNLVVRIAYPYRATCAIKKDFVHAILHRLQSNAEVAALTDHIFTPTFIDDVAQAFDLLIAERAGGIYHVVGASSLSPYEAAQKIAAQFGCNQALITQVQREKFYRNRAPRPFQLRLKNAKIASLGFKMQSFVQGLTQIQKQGVT